MQNARTRGLVQASCNRSPHDEIAQLFASDWWSRPCGFERGWHAFGEGVGYLMNNIDQKVLSVIADLVQICKDGQHGFETAARDVNATELQQLFRGYASERQQFVRELEAQTVALGDKVDESGSVAGAIHRGWMNLKAGVASNEPAAILAECERGEDAALTAYRKALAENIDPETRGIVVRQLASVKAAHDRVKSLRDSSTYANA